MLVKAASAFAGFLIGIGQTIIGYVPNAVEAADTVFGMRMIGLPFILVAASFFIYRRY